MPTTKTVRSLARVSLLIASVLALCAAAAAADNTVNASQVVVVSDDIHKTTTQVLHAADAAGNAPAANASSNNRSGLGDGTNPGKGGGKKNSPNQGTNNPNQAKR